MVTSCVIGAGVSGLAALKALRAGGIDVVCLEKGSQIGGLWRYDNDNRQSAIYQSLRMNTSKKLTAFSDFPMPDDYPDFPDHRQVAAYLDAVVEHFALRPLIRFRTEVSEVAPAPEGGWTVATADGSRARYDAVLVANGHHWKPRLPSFTGNFSGRQIHSHEYRRSESFQGRRVLVVGIGNSGVDIACDVSRVAAATFISTRRGAHVFPKHLLGRPIDAWGAGPASFLPLRAQGWIVGALLRLTRGRLSHYGLPEPSHRIDQTHPTVSAELLDLLREGRLKAKPDLRELRGDRIAFSDGSEEAIDDLVLATGYEVSFPFLNFVPDGDAFGRTLFLNVVSPAHPGLYFVGLAQPLQGPVLRTAEAQSTWIASLLTGACALAGTEEMKAQVEAQNRWRDESLVKTARHGLEVNYYAYVRSILRELQRRPR